MSDSGLAKLGYELFMPEKVYKRDAPMMSISRTGVIYFNEKTIECLGHGKFWVNFYINEDEGMLIIANSIEAGGTNGASFLVTRSSLYVEDRFLYKKLCQITGYMRKEYMPTYRVYGAAVVAGVLFNLNEGSLNIRTRGRLSPKSK